MQINQSNHGFWSTFQEVFHEANGKHHILNDVDLYLAGKITVLLFNLG